MGRRPQMARRQHGQLRECLLPEGAAFKAVHLRAWVRVTRRASLSLGMPSLVSMPWTALCLFPGLQTHPLIFSLPILKVTKYPKRQLGEHSTKKRSVDAFD